MPLDDTSHAKNVSSETILMWFQPPFLDFLKEGQTVSVTGYYFVIPDFHYKKVRQIFLLKSLLYRSMVRFFTHSKLVALLSTFVLM